MSREINCRAFVADDIIEGRKAQMYIVMSYRWKPSGNEVDLWDGLMPITTLAVKWCQVMWSTGLKDKNGVGIYDGDLIKNERYKYPHKIIYTFGEFVGKQVKGKFLGYANGIFFDRFEIIGNIYENPELIS